MNLTQNVKYVGMQNPAMRTFDIIMRTEYGTSYNSYLVLGDKKVLIETVHERYSEDFIDKISEYVPVSELDYVILNHTEPDHSGSLAALLKINPEITVIGTSAAIMNLKNIMNICFKSQIVKQGDSLDIGQGMVLDFIIAPNLHWPDSMFTYLKKDKVLFSCDFLGTHYCEPLVLDTKLKHPEKYEAERLNYYECIFSPFKKFVLDGLAKIENLEIDMVCTSHGPVLVEKIKETMTLYREWSTASEHTPYAALFYVSAYGYTRKIAQIIEKTLTDAGIETKKFDILEHDPAKLAAVMNGAKAVLFGSPTINRDALHPVWDLIARTDAIGVRNKPALVFGSYGWSGEACGLLSDRLKGLKYKVFDDLLKVQFAPSDEDIENIKAAAREFAGEF